MKKVNLFTLLFAGVVLIAGGCASGEQKEISIVPKPLSMEATADHYALKEGLTISVSEEGLRPAAEYLKSMLEKGTGFQLSVIDSAGDIRLSKNNTTKEEGAYSLVVASNGVQIDGNTYGAVISGIATLRQLLPAEIERPAEQNQAVKWTIPGVTINDMPRFAWRGMMLDVARHFCNKEEVKKFLDLMALYKLNKFHWHLTDDQGWRVEIKQYPLLTEKGAWRKYNSHDKSCMNLARSQENPDYNLPSFKLKVVEGDTLYGGFYTQEDIREVVAYAAQRGIDVMPEVDMPGHFLAAIHNYPELACTGKIGWGQTFSSPICPGKESTLEFCKNVYREIFDLFPYEYVHLGADEVEKMNWKTCADCQKRMKKQGLKTEEELQSWFVHEMEAFFNENGKKLVGWDEIIEGGLSKSATVMWWRSWVKNAAPTAIAQGNRVIMAPNAKLYFDAQQDKNSLKGVYDVETLFPVLTPEQEKLVAGVQANLWAEWIPSMQRVEYMVMPRMMALSEMAWTPASQKDWSDFRRRLPAHFYRLDGMGVNYRIPDLEGFHQTNSFTDKTMLNIKCLLPEIEIRYTTDGTTPTQASARYTEPVPVTETTDFTFRTFRPNGTAGDIVKTQFIKEPFADSFVGITFLGDGLKAVWHDYRGNNCKDIEAAPVKGEYVVEKVMIPQGVKGNIGLVLTGYLEVPADSVYTFALMSDDGSVLTIDDQVIIDNDGPHSPREMVGQKALKKGAHTLKIHYFDYNGGLLELRTFNEKGEYQDFPKAYFKY